MVWVEDNDLGKKVTNRTFSWIMLKLKYVNL